MTEIQLLLREKLKFFANTDVLAATRDERRSPFFKKNPFFLKLLSKQWDIEKNFLTNYIF